MKSEELIDLLLNGLQPGFKFSDLEGKGVFSEEVSESEDARIITRTFKAYDESFSKSLTLYIPKESKQDVVAELNRQIKEAVGREDYEQAALLQKQKREYLRS